MALISSGFRPRDNVGSSAALTLAAYLSMSTFRPSVLAISSCMPTASEEIPKPLLSESTLALLKWAPGIHLSPRGLIARFGCFTFSKLAPGRRIGVLV